MNSKTVTYVFLSFIAILGWNAFLIQRDNKLFEAYNRPNASEILNHQPSSKIGYSPKERFCQSQAKWHPDCNIE